jgi:hypothetical protein
LNEKVIPELLIALVVFPSHMDTTTTILYMCTTDVKKYNGMVLSKKFSNYDI